MVFRRIATMTTPTNPAVRKQHVSALGHLRSDTSTPFFARLTAKPCWSSFLFYSHSSFFKKQINNRKFFLLLGPRSKKILSRVSTSYFEEELGYVVCRSIYSRL